jgi:hypothetical protein
VSSGRSGRFPAHRLPLTAYLAALTACGVSPLTNKIDVGEEPFVVAVGEGPDSLTDLWAAPAGGGRFVRLTFNRPEERVPRLSPDGSMVAFLRASHGDKGPPWSLVVLHLRSSAESAAPLPDRAGEPERLGWSRDSRHIVVSAGGFLITPAPPEGMELRPIATDSLGLADSLSRELLGEPPRGMIRECGQGGLCVRAETGELTLLDSTATGAVRWGADSLGYFLPDGFEVRPLGGGRSRRPVWSGAPARLRQLTHHPGTPRLGGGPSGIR